MLFWQQWQGGEHKPFSASGLAKDTFLPEPTVSKVLKLLAKGGVITSTRGVKGGYMLKCKPDQLYVRDIIAAMEGPIMLTSCVKGNSEICGIESICMLQGRWNPVNQAIESALANVALSDMIPALQARQSL